MLHQLLDQLHLELIMNLYVLNDVLVWSRAKSGKRNFYVEDPDALKNWDFIVSDDILSNA
jgi:hypothetical protein